MLMLMMMMMIMMMIRCEQYVRVCRHTTERVLQSPVSGHVLKSRDLVGWIVKSCEFDERRPWFVSGWTTAGLRNHWSSYRWCAVGLLVTVRRACHDIDRRRFSAKFVYSRANPITYFDQKQRKFGNIWERHAEATAPVKEMLASPISACALQNV